MGTIGAMTLPKHDVAMSWVGLPVQDATGGQVGTCTALYVDEATDLPEWALVEMADDAGSRFVPLVDAREESGALRLSFGADLIDAAPQVGDQDHLSGPEEAELYQHYGVAFSAGASDTLLPAAVTDATTEGTTAEATTVEAVTPLVRLDDERDVGMDTTPPLQPEPLPVPEPVLPTPAPEPLQPSPAPEPLRPSPAPPAPEPPQPSPAPPASEPLRPSQARTRTPRPAPALEPAGIDAKRSQRTGPSAEAVVGGLAGASTAAVLLIRERRRAPRPGRRNRRGVRSVGGALGDVAGVVTGVAQALGSELARTSGQLTEATADVAQTGTRAVTGAGRSGVRATVGAVRSRARIATEAAESGVRAAADAAQGGAHVVTGAADSARDVAVESRRQVRRSRRQVRRSWRRTARRAAAAVGLGAGYLLGARAGERRYAQLRSAATRLGGRLRSD